MNKTNLSLKIAWFYPDLMSTYGDRGNIICLTKRCEWRGIDVHIKEIGLEEKANNLLECDLLFMGGAQDRQQKIASEDLQKNKGVILKQMIEEKTPGLFICGAYQFMGHYYQPAEGERILGLGIFDLYTVHPGKEKERCIGNIVVECKMANSEEQTEKELVGFENHGGRTYLGKNVQALGLVLKGFGNNGEDKTEGCIYNNSIGTYLHGPVLPKNPHLADYLVKTALSKKYKDEVKLDNLDDSLEWQAHNSILAKIK